MQKSLIFSRFKRLNCQTRECKFALWDKPIPKPCPKCGNTLVEKKDIIKCTECDYEEKK